MHPHALLRMSLVVMVASIACFTMSGCGKQQKVAPAKMPQVSKEPSAGAADTADVFKEFYSEDSTKKKAGAKSKKAGKPETFSPSSASSQPEFSPKGRYTVQITCVRSKSFADNMTSKMKDKGYPAYVAEVQNPTPNLSGTFYRVRIGGFDGLSAAKSFGENTLVASGYQYWVDKKSNDNVGMEGYGLGSGSAGSNAAGSYDNAPPAAAPATTPAAPSSSYDSPNNTYSSPSSSSSTSSSGSSATSSGTPSTYQPPATTTGSAAAPASSQPAPASSASSTASPAPSAAPAASSAPAAASSGTQTGSTTGKTGASSSTESGWGTDSSSKSGW
jgi:SPOR domain